MGIRFNPFISSLGVQNQLARTEQAIQRSMERLSSGLRVNRASDDPAALSISTGLTSQVRGLRQAVQNINSSLGLILTADGGLSNQLDILARMQEIALQSSSGTLSTSDRSSLDQEIQQLYKEFQQITNSTQFNGINLLDGSFSATTLQIGSSRGDQIGFSLPSTSTSNVFNLLSTVGTGSGTLNNLSGTAGSVQFTLPAGSALNKPLKNTYQIDVGTDAQMGKETISTITTRAANTIPAMSFESDLIGTLDGGSIAQSSAFSWFEPASQTNIYVWYNIDGGGSDPADGNLGIEVDINSTDTEDQVAHATADAINGAGISNLNGLSEQPLTASYGPSGSFFLNHSEPGDTGGLSDNGAGVSFSVNSPGSANWIGFNSGPIPGNDDNYIWYKVDGIGGDPGNQASGVSLEVDLLSTDNADTVATKTSAVLTGAGFTNSVLANQITLHQKTGAHSISDSGVGFTVQTIQAGNLDSPYFTVGDGASNKYAFWFNIDGNGLNPMVVGYTNVEVDISSGDSANTVASDLVNAMDGVGLTGSAVGSQVTVSTTTDGADPVDSYTNFGFSKTQTGTRSPYFTLSSPTGLNYAIYFNVDGTGVDPNVAGYTSIGVSVGAADTSSTVATKFRAALSSLVATTGISTNLVTVNWTDVGRFTTPTDANIGTGSAVSTATTGTSPDISVGGNPAQPVLVDINGDNFLDAIVADNSTNMVSVLLGTAYGGFTPSSTISVGAGPLQPVLKDINGDGKLDMIVTNKGTTSGTISVLLGDGHGNFTSTSTLTIGANASQVTVVDLGNGHQDLLVSDANDAAVVSFIGDGTGTFAFSATNIVGTTPQQPTFGDVNDDGKIDMLVTNQGSNSVSVRLGDGAGHFSSGTSVTGFNSPTQNILKDLNNDGKLDLIVSNSGNGTLSIMLGNGSGGFTPSSTLTIGATPTTPVLADVNGDGKIDLVVANTGSSNVSVLLGNGSGGFSAASTITVNSSPSVSALADLNGDGKLDMVVKSANTISILFGNGAGAFTAMSTLSITSTLTTPIIADINHDGVPDVVFTDFATHSVGIWTQNSTTTTTNDSTGISVSTQSKAQDLLKVLDYAVDYISNARASLGAIHNRLISAAEVSALTADNLDAARSAVIDTDMALEVANLVKNQMLQQVQVAVLAQANIEAEMITQLLKFDP